jgi:hypothetical protein
LSTPNSAVSAADARASTDQPRRGAVLGLVASLTLELRPGVLPVACSSSSKRSIDPYRPEIVTDFGTEAGDAPSAAPPSGSLPTRQLTGHTRCVPVAPARKGRPLVNSGHRGTTATSARGQRRRLTRRPGRAFQARDRLARRLRRLAREDGGPPTRASPRVRKLAPEAVACHCTCHRDGGE